jgi:hypothetical protein
MKVKQPFTFDIKNDLERILFQDKLFSLGFGWSYGGQEYHKSCPKDTKIVVERSRIYFNARERNNHISFQDLLKLTKIE